MFLGEGWMTRFVALLIVLIFGVAASGCDTRKEASTAKPAATKLQSAPLDINRASAKELMALKGIGEVRAAAIIRGRPYARKDELVQQGIVPYAVYDEIKEQIVAKQK